MDSKIQYIKILVPKKKSIELLADIDEQFREASGFPAEGTIYCQPNSNQRQLTFTIKNGNITLINFPLIIRRDITKIKPKEGYIQFRNLKLDSKLEEVIAERWYTKAPRETEDSSLISNDILILPATIVGESITKNEITPQIRINETILYKISDIPKEAPIIYYRCV